MAKNTRELSPEELANVSGGCNPGWGEARERVGGAFRAGFYEGVRNHTNPWESGRERALDELIDINEEIANGHGHHESSSDDSRDEKQSAGKGDSEDGDGPGNLPPLPSPEVEVKDETEVVEEEKPEVTMTGSSGAPTPPPLPSLT